MGRALQILTLSVSMPVSKVTAGSGWGSAGASLKSMARPSAATSGCALTSAMCSYPSPAADIMSQNESTRGFRDWGHAPVGSPTRFRTS